MSKRFPVSAQLGSQVQTRISQAASALSEVLRILGEHEGKVRKARGERRQDFLRGALRLLSQIHFSSVALEDRDLNLLTLASLEQELESLGAVMWSDMQEILSLSKEELQSIREQIARLEAVRVTLDRALIILQAPSSKPSTQVGRLQFDLSTRITMLTNKTENMLRLLENTREAETARFSYLRPQIEKALGLLHNAGVLPKRSSRDWGQSERDVSTRNRLVGGDRLVGVSK